MNQTRITLYAEDFSSQDGTTRLLAEFDTIVEARNAAETRIKEDLKEYYRIGQDYRDQLRQWMMFGEDLFLVPDDPLTPFSALDYAREFLGVPVEKE
jgi:hypothetical protein